MYHLISILCTLSCDHAHTRLFCVAFQLRYFYINVCFLFDFWFFFSFSCTVSVAAAAVNVPQKYYVLFDFHSPKRMNSSAVEWKIYDDFFVYNIHWWSRVYGFLCFFSIELKESPRLVGEIMQRLKCLNIW